MATWYVKEEDNKIFFIAVDDEGNAGVINLSNKGEFFNLWGEQMLKKAKLRKNKNLPNEKKASGGRKS